MNIAKLLVLTCAALGAAHCAAQDSNGIFAPLQVPAKTLPVPADVSPELQKIIAAPRRPGWDVLWKTGEEWRAAANAQASKTMQTLPAMRERLHVTVQPCDDGRGKGVCRHARRDSTRTSRQTPDSCSWRLLCAVSRRRRERQRRS